METPSTAGLRSPASAHSSAAVRRRVFSRSRPLTIGKYLFVSLLSIYILLPIYWVAITAFKPAKDIFAYPPVWVPTSLTLDSFVAALNHFNGLEAMRNSVIVAGGSTILAMVVGTMAGYSLARYRSRGRAISWYLLTQRMIPAVALIFPSFMLFQALGWVDTYQALIVVYAAAVLPFTVWMIRSYILEIPHEIEESAVIDGCNLAGVLYYIVMPLAAPGLATTAIFVFVFGWIEFLFAVILTRSEAVTLPVVVAGFYGTQSAMYGAGAALALLAMVPVLILTLVLQRHLVRGLTVGAVKG